MTRRVVGAGLAVVTVVAVIVVAASSVFGYRQGGPLEVADKAGVIWPAAIGDTFTWAMPLDNQTSTDIVIESIAPDGVEGLEVLGVLASDQGCEVPSISRGFPPSEVSTIDPEGARLDPQEPCALLAMVGVRRTEGEAPATIRGLRIRYRFEGAAYEDLLPWSLEVKDPGP